jgi:hypothetical protein
MICLDDEDLDEDDIDLLEENTGIKLNRSSGVKYSYKTRLSFFGTQFNDFFFLFSFFFF